MSSHIWFDERPTPNDHLLPASSSTPGVPYSARSHREIVPYSPEWRVILRSTPRGRTVLYNPHMQSLVIQTTVGLDSHPMDGANNTSGYMDSNYFQMLADANVALSRRGSLQDNTESEIPEPSPIGSPTSSSRASLDIDTPPLDDRRKRSRNAKNPSNLSHDALNQGYYVRFFVEQMKLGRGFRGSVFLCQHILDGIPLGEYAIKKVAVGDNHDWLAQMLREVHLLERLHHPNIVAYKHAWLENHQLHKFGPEVTCLFILMECANGGNLEEYIERSAETPPRKDNGTPASDESGQPSEKKPMTARERLQSKRQHLQGVLNSPPSKGSESTAGGSPAQQRHYLTITEIWSFFFDICEGLAHLHRLGIIHRDLKPPNLLLSYSNSQIKGSKGERPRILITDFGECEISEQAAKRDRTGATGTLEFLAPELLAVDANGRYTNEFSFKGDMWSLGMVLYYLCYSRLPYTQIDDVDVLREEIREFKSITLPPDESSDRVIPDELKILIRVLLSTDKSKRPSCDEILSMLSQQRDRMVHGNMDSPTATSIRATSSAFSTQSSKNQDESEDNRKDDVSNNKEQQLPSSKILQSPASNRQQYLSPTFGVTRRRSRATLVTDSLKNSSGQVMHSPTSAVRNTASPSSNLHKKVKPLGLGLRHMLRRRMMHPATISGAGMYKYPQNEQSSPSAQRSWDMMTTRLQASKPVYHPSPPMAMDLDQLPILKTVGRPLSHESSVVVGQRQMDWFQQRQFQLKKQAAIGKESGLGLEVRISAQLRNSSADKNSESFSSADTKDRATSTVLSSSPLRRSTRQSTTRSRQKYSEHTIESSQLNNSSLDQLYGKQKRRRDTNKDQQLPQRENIDNDSKESISDNDNASFSEEYKEAVLRQQQFNADRNDRNGKTGIVTKAHSPLGKGYWANLASTHMREMSRSDSRELRDNNINLDISAAIDDAIHQKQLNEASGSSGSEADYGGDEERGLTSYQTGEMDRQNLQRQRQSRRRRQRTGPQQSTSTLNKHVIQLQPSQSSHPSMHSTSLPNASSLAGLPEHFSTHYMFISLIIRVWACLSICNPAMVRPLVLYPVLATTVVWDRYILSLISERLFRRRQKKRSLPASSGTRKDQITRNERKEQNGRPDTEETLLLSRDYAEDSVTISNSDAVSALINDEHMSEDPNSRQGSVVLKTPHISQVEENDLAETGEDETRFTLVWQALLSGVVVQVVWVGLVWLFSRGRVCAI
ncbi:putative serine/threonine-protein kinase iks1 [Linnemannia zychae]|nr:putative serine/threonine-protein kinase iks1 [Linnemannia zychae]